MIGTGSWGSRVAREAMLLLKEGALTSVSICELDQKRLDAFREANSDIGKGLSGLKYYTKVDDAINDGLDYAHICTQNSSHLDIVKKMVENKIAFVVEKPVSDRISDVDEIERLCKANPKVIAKNGLIFRFDNSMKEIKRIHDSGSLGKVHFLRFSWEFSRPYMEGVDIIWDLMPHLVDMFQFITGEKATFVSGMKMQFRRKEGSELGVVVLQTPSGIKGIFNISWFATRKNRLIEIFGDKKVLGADILSQSITLFDANDIAKSEVINPVKNNTIKDELMNLISDAGTGKNTVNNIEIGIGIAKFLDKIDKGSTGL